MVISVQNSFQKLNEKIDYETSLGTIKRNAKNLNPVFNNWMSWRLVLPIAVFELTVFFIFFFIEQDIILLINKILFAGILGALVGWVWEKKGRQKEAILQKHQKE